MVQGVDDRVSTNKTLKALKKQIGPSAKGLDVIDTPTGFTGRIAKIFAAELPFNNFATGTADIKKFNKPLGAMLTTDRQKWALNRSAEAIARALVIPCLVTLSGEDKAKKNFIMEGKEVSPIQCFALLWILTKEG